MEGLNHLAKKLKGWTGSPSQPAPEPVPLETALNWVTSKAGGRDVHVMLGGNVGPSVGILDAGWTGEFFVNLMQTRDTWEEGTLLEQLPLSDWIPGIAVDGFLD